MRHRCPTSAALLATCGWLALSSCLEGVPLGSECPGSLGPCDDDASEDAGAADDDADSGDDEDGGDGDPLLRRLENPSFELTAGEPGGITQVSMDGTAIAPWYTCQAVGSGMAGPLSAVRAEREVGPFANDDEPLVAPDGQTFVGIQHLVGILPVPLVQELSTPLEVGEEYAFALDVRAASDASQLRLEVWGSNENCFADAFRREPLATSLPVRAGEWQTVCLRFSAPLPFTHLALSTASMTVVDGNRLFIDNLRSARDCPDPDDD